MINDLTELLQDNDGISFILKSQQKDIIELKVTAIKYPEHGDIIFENDIGKKQHIVLYRIDEDGQAYDGNVFEAIIGDVPYYISKLIKANYYGFVSVMTTTSTKYFEDIYKKRII